MRRKSLLLDQILVIDLEATCWDDNISFRPPGMENEIIEIGISELNHQTGKIVQGDLFLVKPVRSEVSKFCTQLTTWTAADLVDGCTFEAACTRLCQQFSSRRRVFASWGNYDRNQFERQCRAFNVPYPFGPSHLNVKDLFSLQMGLTKTVNTMEAMKMLDIEPTGTWHIGRDDAFNIARVLSALLGHKEGE